MAEKFIDRIIEKTGHADLIDALTKKISSSELNSLMLEIYRTKSEGMTPPELLKRYASNRFVKPSRLSPIEFMELEADILKTAESFSFVPVELSPLAAFGSCSVVAGVNQNNVVSSLRDTEAVADATNSLALHICDLKKRMKSGTESSHAMRFCAVHRHVRTQMYEDPNSLPHFKLFCMVSADRDAGSYRFEKEALLEHLRVYERIFRNSGYAGDILIKFTERGKYPDSEGFMERIESHLRGKTEAKMEFLRDPSGAENRYYRGVQFKIHLDLEGGEFEVADGGFVDWSQKLLQNRKERMMISGLGLERFAKIVRKIG